LTAVRASFDLSPSAPDHLPEHPGRKPAKIDAACFGESPDKPPETTPESADRVEFSHVETPVSEIAVFGPDLPVIEFSERPI